MLLKKHIGLGVRNYFNNNQKMILTICVFFYFDYISHNHERASIYLLKVDKRSTRARCEIYSKLTIKTPERRQ